MSTKVDRLWLEIPKIIEVIKRYHGKVNPSLEIPLEEFKRRQDAVNKALEEQGLPVFS